MVLNNYYRVTNFIVRGQWRHHINHDWLLLLYFIFTFGCHATKFNLPTIIPLFPFHSLNLIIMPTSMVNIRSWYIFCKIEVIIFQFLLFHWLWSWL